MRKLLLAALLLSSSAIADPPLVPFPGVFPMGGGGGGGGVSGGGTGVTNEVAWWQSAKTIGPSPPADPTANVTFEALMTYPAFNGFVFNLGADVSAEFVNGYVVASTYDSLSSVYRGTTGFTGIAGDGVLIYPTATQLLSLSNNNGTIRPVISGVVATDDVLVSTGAGIGQGLINANTSHALTFVSNEAADRILQVNTGLSNVSPVIILEGPNTTRTTGDMCVLNNNGQCVTTPGRSYDGNQPFVISTTDGYISILAGNSGASWFGLTVVGNGGDALGASGDVIFDRHLISRATGTGAGTTPAVTGTCTTPSLGTHSTDVAGSVSSGGCTTTQTIILTFGHAYTAASTFCTVSSSTDDQTVALYSYTRSASAITIIAGAAGIASGVTFVYQCIGTT